MISDLALAVSLRLSYGFCPQIIIIVRRSYDHQGLRTARARRVYRLRSCDLKKNVNVQTITNS